MTQDTQDELYEKLTILDQKCSTLAQISSLALAISALVALKFPPGDAWRGRLAMALLTAFFVSCVTSLLVIWINWQPSAATVRRRTVAYRVSYLAGLAGIASLYGLAISVF